VGEPKVPRATDISVLAINFAFTAGSCIRAMIADASRPDAVSASRSTSGSSIFFGASHMWWNIASTYRSRPPSISAATAPRIICSVFTGK
jgi:hypothetical protein